MKKATRFYLIAIAISLVLIGLGCGISVFEFSTYKAADYHTDSANALPPLAWNTQDVTIPLQEDQPLILELYAAEDIQYDYDDSMNGQVVLHIENVEDVPECSLNKVSDNVPHYYLDCYWNDFSEFKLFMQLAKEGYILNALPGVHITIHLNPADKDRIQVNPPFDASVEKSDMEEDLRTSFEEQLQEQQEQHMAELEEKDMQIAEVQQLYEEQLAQKDEEIQSLTMELDELKAQLDRIRASVNE